MLEPKKVQWFDDRYYRVLSSDGIKYFPSVTTVLGVVSKPFLAKWRGDIGNREADLRLFLANESGSRVHAACEALTYNGAVYFDPHIGLMEEQRLAAVEVDALHYKHQKVVALKYQEELLKVYRFQQLLKVLKPKCLLSEVSVYDDVNGCAGSFDYLWQVEEGEYSINGAKPLFLPGGFYIWDLKSGNALDDDYQMQVAKYASMVNMMIAKGEITQTDGTFVEYGGIIHVASTTRTGIQGLSCKFIDTPKMAKLVERFDNRLLPEWKDRHLDQEPKVFDLPMVLTMEESE